MAICIKCGREGNACLCDNCKKGADLEALCNEILEYKPGMGVNQLWDEIAVGMTYTENFKNLVFAVSADLPTPRKEYMRLLCLAAGSANVSKASRPWLYEVYEVFKTNAGLTTDEKNRVRGVMLGALYMDYRYEEADSLAGKLLEQVSLPKQAFYNLADFLLKTRRYDEASDAIEAARRLYGDDASAVADFNKLSEQNEKYRAAEATGKGEYMPNPKENRDAVRKAYLDFLATIGINAEVPSASSRYPVPIPKDQYPALREVREADFDSFVAFDLETTGFSTTIDSIIEIGAVKVVNGNIVDSAEFTFQEFVKPFKRSVRQEITDVTGITKEDVVGAREMWEVIPDFMKFVGDNILVGFNNVRFDSKFLVRAGRYSNLVIENPHFDVMRYAEQFEEQFGIDSKKCSLEELCEKLGIENPKAHRALADAMTTANVYLKLKEMGSGAAEVSVDDLLSDLDEW